MKEIKKKSFVLIPHNEDCFTKNGKYVWSGLLDGYYHGNFNGNKDAKRGKNHIWYKMMCNDPKCKAIKAIHSSVLVNA